MTPEETIFLSIWKSSHSIDPNRYSIYDKLRPILDRPQRNLWLLFGFVPLIGIAAFIYLNTAPAERDRIILFLCFTFIFAGIAATILFLDLQNWRAKRLLGYIDLDFEAFERNKGITGVIRFAPKNAGQIQQIEMKLLILESRKEVRIKGYDPNHTVVHNERIFYDSMSDTRPRNIHANEPFEVKLSLKSDSPLPVTYDSESHQIEWLVTIKIALTGRGFWRKKIPVNASYKKYA